MSLGRQNPDDWDIEYDQAAQFDSGLTRDQPEPDSDSSAPTNAHPVLVETNEEGSITNVSLASDWKLKIDPRELRSEVVSAAQTAIIQLLDTKAQEIDFTPNRSEPTSPDAADRSPLSANDVQRLLDDAYSELEQFSASIADRLDKLTSATSSGSHVQGSAKNGQIIDLWIDTAWCSVARTSEIELELNEVVRNISHQSNVGSLTPAPQSRSIDELNSLANSPQILLQRLGLLPPER